MERDISFLTKSLIAHRGVHNMKNKIPENSLKAFKRAIEGNYIIELDVHILKDNEVVVFHDDNLKRMTGIDKFIKDMTYDEIKKIKLGDTDQTIPRLEDVLKLIKGKVPLIIELKYDVKCGVLEREVINILKKYKGEYAVKSFNPFSINYFRKNFPEVIRGQLFSNFRTKKMSKLKSFFYNNMLYNLISKPDFISYDIRSLPSKKINRLRKNKIILGWTVRNSDDLNKARKYCDNYICENIFEI